jgi:glycosyltransferase involved in cell wall biosynthesis
VTYIVLPGDVDDVSVPSGGNTFDRRICNGLAAAGRPVHEIAINGGWPWPGRTARTELAAALDALPDGAPVLIDGLVACGVPEIIVPRTGRLRVAVLFHSPLRDARPGAELKTLRAAHTVVVTSPWSARWLAGHYGLDARKIHVVPPGTDPAPLAVGTDGFSRLLCVASVSEVKGHDLLVEALAEVADLPWTCSFVGSLRRDEEYAIRLRDRITALGLAGRIDMTGPRTGARLASAYRAADLVVLPSRAETYGMVVAEALARGIPVLARSVDAVPETLGRDKDGRVPGLLVPALGPAALAEGLCRWFGDLRLRAQLRGAACQRRRQLRPWTESARQMSEVLERLCLEPVG